MKKILVFFLVLNITILSNYNVVSAEEEIFYEEFISILDSYYEDEFSLYNSINSLVNRDVYKNYRDNYIIVKSGKSNNYLYMFNKDYIEWDLSAGRLLIGSFNEYIKVFTYNVSKSEWVDVSKDYPYNDQTFKKICDIDTSIDNIDYVTQSDVKNNNIIFTNENIYINDTVFFSAFQRKPKPILQNQIQVQAQHLTPVMTEVMKMIPILVGLVVLWIALRKGLALFSQLLRKA